MISPCRYLQEKFPCNPTPQQTFSDYQTLVFPPNVYRSPCLRSVAYASVHRAAQSFHTLHVQSAYRKTGAPQDLSVGVLLQIPTTYLYLILHSYGTTGPIFLVIPTVDHVV